MTIQPARAWSSPVLPMFLVALCAGLGVALASHRSVSAVTQDRQPGGGGLERDIDERATQLLRTMGEALRGAKNIQFRAVSTEGVVDETTGRIVHYITEQTVSVARPDRLRVNVGDSFSRHETWFEDGTLTVYDSLLGHYTSIRAPKDVDDMLDTLREEHELIIPLGDLVVADPFSALMEGVMTGDYLGVAMISGQKCHQLAMRQDDLDWQIWIAADGPAVPLKLVITYTSDGGHPQFASRFEDWDLTASFEPGHFAPSLPPTAVEVDLPTFRSEGDAS